MALPIRDGNQSLTTLSTILVSNSHIPAHTVVSFGAQAITDILSAVSNGIAISGTVTAQTDLDTSTGAPCVVLGFGTPAGVSRVSYNNGFPVQIQNTTGSLSPSNPLAIFGTVTIGSALPAGTNSIGVVTIGAGTVTIGNNITLLGIQASGFTDSVLNGAGIPVYPRDDSSANASFPIAGTVTVGNTVTIAGTVTANPTGTQTIAGTVTANSNVVSISLSAFPLEMISGGDLFKVDLSTINDTSPPTWLGAGGGNVPISGTVTVGNSVTIGSIPPIQWSNANGGNAPTTVNQNAPLPVQLYTGAVPSSVTIGATIANSVTIGSLPSLVAGTAQIGSVTAVNHQGTTVTTSNFTSTTPSTILASANTGREVLTIFNEGAGNLHISAGATCTTIAYQVRLLAGDYYEAPINQTSLTHSAVFATAGTARVTQVS